jgi:hypothetical protein
MWDDVCGDIDAFSARNVCHQKVQLDSQELLGVIRSLALSCELVIERKQTSFSRESTEKYRKQEINSS